MPLKPAALVAIFIGCLSSTASAVRPLVVVMGGFGSCGGGGGSLPRAGSMLFADHAQCHVGEAWPGTDSASPSTLYSCFTAGLNPATARMMFGRAGETPREMRTGDPAEVIRRFTEFVRREAGDREVLFIAHSHGAWLAMHTALAFPPERASFVAIDPVSRVHCPPSTFQTAINLRARTVNIPLDCAAFPSDFTRDQVNRLFRSGRKVATNVFAGGRDGGSPLTLPHSGIVVAAAGPSVNRRIGLPVVDASDIRDNRMSGTDHDPTRFIAHQAVTRDRRSWQHIRESVEAGYGITLGACARYSGVAPSLASQVPRLAASGVRLAAHAAPVTSPSAVTHALDRARGATSRVLGRR